MQVFEYGVDEWLALCKHFKRLSDKYPDDWEAPASADLEDSTLVRSMNQMSISCLCMDLTSLENAPLFLPSNTSVPLQEMIEQKARLPQPSGTSSSAAGMLLARNIAGDARRYWNHDAYIMRTECIHCMVHRMTMPLLVMCTRSMPSSP